MDDPQNSAERFVKIQEDVATFLEPFGGTMPDVIFRQLVRSVAIQRFREERAAARKDEWLWERPLGRPSEGGTLHS